MDQLLLKCQVFLIGKKPNLISYSWCHSTQALYGKCIPCAVSEAGTAVPLSHLVSPALLSLFSPIDVEVSIISKNHISNILVKLQWLELQKNLRTLVSTLVGEAISGDTCLVFGTI